MNRLTLLASMAFLLCASSFAAGDAEWQSGVNALNSARREVNANSGALRKAGVNVGRLQQQISMAERQLERARWEMMKANQSYFQNSTRTNILNQYDIFKSNSAFSSTGKLHLVPVPNFVDMGMSNAFSAHGTLVKSAPLCEINPTIPFRPMRSPEEVLKDHSSLTQPQPTAGQAISSLKTIPPPSQASAGSSSLGVIDPNAVSSMTPSSGPGSLGVIDPNALKAGNPVYNMKTTAPPLPQSTSTYTPPPPATTGNYDVITSNSTKVNGYNLLPPEKRNPDNVNVSGFIEGETPLAKGKLSVGTGGVDLEAGKQISPIEGSIGKHWDWNGDSSVVRKLGTNVDIPFPMASVSVGANRSWSSTGENVDAIEVGVSKGFKIPLKSVEAKAGVNVSFEWKDIDDPSERVSQLYGPYKTK